MPAAPSVNAEAGRARRVPRLARYPAPACPRGVKGTHSRQGACHPPWGDVTAGANGPQLRKQLGPRRRVTAVRFTRPQRREGRGLGVRVPRSLRGHGHYPCVDRHWLLASDEPRSPRVSRHTTMQGGNFNHTAHPDSECDSTMRVPAGLHPWTGPPRGGGHRLARRRREDEKVAVASQPHVHLGIWR